MNQLIADIRVRHVYIHIIKSDEGRYGWVESDRPIHKNQYWWKGNHIGTGRAFEVNLANRFGSLDSCIWDIKDGLSYDHGIRRVESSKILNHALAFTS